MQDYEYRLEHRAGKKMQHVDALSRCNTILAIEENTFEDNLVICQARDEKLSKIREILSNGEHKMYEMRKGIIYRKIKDNIVFYVPEAMVDLVLFRYHNEMGHLGTDKVTEIISRSYWFPNIRRRVQEHISNCLKCIAFSAKTGGQEGFLHVISKGNVPFQVVHVDHFGPINYKDSTKRHILVVVDACTKFVRLYPTRTTRSTEAIDALEDYFRAYSRPSHIVSDRGSCFSSEEFQQFLTDNNIIHIKIATGSPQANGQVERINRDLRPMISKLISTENGKPWHRVLPDVEYAMNNTVHRSVNQCPSVMLFGTAQKGKLVDSLKENIVDKEQTYSDVTVREIREKAEEVQQRVQSYNKTYVDKIRRNPKVYKEGDYVMITNFNSTTGVSSKLLPRFKGPYKIHKVLGNDRYCLRDVDGFQQTQRPYEGIWAVQNIKPWFEGCKAQTIDESDDEENSESNYDKEEVINKHEEGEGSSISDSNSVLGTHENGKALRGVGVTTRGMLARNNTRDRINRQESGDSRNQDGRVVDLR